MWKCLVSTATVLVCVASVSAQDKNWRNGLEQQLKEFYTITKMDNSLFSGPATIKTPGIVLVVQQAGIEGHPPGTIPIAAGVANVRNGQLERPEGAATPTSYLFKVGDKVYVGDIDVNDDNIVLWIFTVEAVERTIKGSTRNIRFFANVRFRFDRGFLPTAALDDIKKEFGSLLPTEEQVASANTKTIELGQTIEQVEKTFGKPLTIIKLGDRTIYTYKDMKVTFIEGKVTEVK